MSYKLFLDDERNPEDVKWVDMPLGPWVIVRSSDEFVDTIMVKGAPSFISFDHDLADEHYRRYHAMQGGEFSYDGLKEKTGYECAKWLLEYSKLNNLNIPFQVHSMNPIGKENIEKLLTRK